MQLVASDKTRATSSLQGLQVTALQLKAWVTFPSELRLLGTCGLRKRGWGGGTPKVEIIVPADYKVCVVFSAKLIMMLWENLQAGGWILLPDGCCALLKSLATLSYSNAKYYHSCWVVHHHSCGTVQQAHGSLTFQLFPCTPGNMRNLSCLMHTQSETQGLLPWLCL